MQRTAFQLRQNPVLVVQALDLRLVVGDIVVPQLGGGIATAIGVGPVVDRIFLCLDFLASMRRLVGRDPI